MRKPLQKMIAAVLVLFLLVNCLPLTAFAAEAEMDLKLSSPAAAPGDSVSVTVEIGQNPGISSLKFDVAFDETILTLTSVSFAEGFGSYVTAPEPYKSPQTISLVSPLETITKNGLLATLTFQVSADAADNSSSDITVTYDPEDVFDGSYNNVNLNVTNGCVSIFHGIPGDIDGDKKVNNKDAILLFRYIAGWSVNVDSGALDVNGDGKVNNKDAITLFRYTAGWPDITLVRGKICVHELEAFTAIPATCTEPGSIAYWRCTICGKYFGDKNATREITLADTAVAALGHTPVVDPEIPPTTTATGLTEGSHCAVCGEVLVAQQVIPKLQSKEHSLFYDISNGDPYLDGLLAEGIITNNNPDRFNEETGLTLRNLSVAGYRFLGWYDGAGSNGIQIRRIDAGTTEDVELYAHWEKIQYKVQFKSSLYLDENEITYTVDTGVVLPTPKLSNYIFTGWADEEGKLYTNKKIPTGTTGNITLTANWTSERNKTWTKTKLDDPIVEVDEENNTLLFVYEIGSIENVPLYTIKDFGYISGDGITKTETATYSVTINETEMEAYTKAVGRATVESANWVLSNEWNECTSYTESKLEEQGMTKEEAETLCKSSTDNWNVSSGSSGSRSSSHVATNSSGSVSESNIYGDYSTTNCGKTTDHNYDNAHLAAESSIGAKVGGIGAEIKAEASDDWGHNHTNETGYNNSQSNGYDFYDRNQNSSYVADSASSSSSWNSSSSYGGSRTSSQSSTTAETVSQKIANTYGYGRNYIVGGSQSTMQGLTSSQTSSDEYSSAVTYSTITQEQVTSTWTTQATKAGYHRWVVAGTAHVFAVVGYDMAAKTYFVYTYSVLDDDTHEFEDYSYTTANYNDEQNGVISFEIPYEIADYVAELTCYSEGLKVDQNTGLITGYTGTDTCVVIPEYMNVGNGKVIKITGISENAFNGNTDIGIVHLSDFTTEIPSNAFSGCTSLIGLSGGSVSSIGDNAFSGCTAIDTCVINSNVKTLGTNAFNGIQRLIINVANAQVLESAVNSGAKDIELYVLKMDDPAAELDGKEITVPENVEYFEFNGNNQAYNNLIIKSNAAETAINEATFTNTGGIPIQISSAEVSFDDVTVLATGIAMVLSATDANVGLQGTIKVQSENTNALLCKNVTLYETNPQVEGRLVVIRKVLVCGDITNKNLLSYDEYETIDETTFYNMLNSYTLFFDANGGTCEETSRKVPNSTPIGDIPTPTRPYYSFAGWYLSDGVTAVTKDTVFSTGLDQTIYAHWDQKPVSGWVKASELPSGAEVVNRKWTYTLTSYTTSSASSLSGWTRYNVTSAWGSWGAWSGWSTDAVYSSDSRQVESESRHTGYDMVVYNTMSTGGSRQFRSYSIAGSYSTYGCSSSYGEYNYSRWVSTGELNGAATVAQGSYTSACSYPGYNKGNGTGYILAYGDLSYVFFVNNYTYSTYYRYRDRSLVYTYYYYKTEQKESASQPSGNDISNVQEWVQYRAY